MSSRKRPLAEIPLPNSTPVRYAPSTPHAIRAFQQRSAAKTRSARAIRHPNTNIVQPNSIRGVLRQFAKISAPVTNKRVATPSSIHVGKENQRPSDGQDDDIDETILKKPNFTLAIEESLEEDDSELPVAPTPSVLLGEDEEQPTITFQNVTRIPLARPVSERSDRRRSGLSFMRSDPVQLEEQEEQDGDLTIMTERGRRAVSEDATGRFSRYSFGSIRMSDFGSELEIRRESGKQEKQNQLELDEYMPFEADESFNGGNTEDLRKLNRSPSVEVQDDTIQLSPAGNETFRLEMPQDEETHEVNAQETPFNALRGNDAVLARADVDHSEQAEEDLLDVVEHDGPDKTSRRQTLLEIATTEGHASRRKRLKLTRHGTAIPSLPSSLIKKVVLDSYEKQSKRKPKLGRDHMKALEQATEWFLEQVGEDLAAYSSHGRRKKRVDTNDVLLLMRRQKVLVEEGELQKLGKGWLSKDVLGSLDLPDTI